MKKYFSKASPPLRPFSGGIRASLPVVIGVLILLDAGCGDGGGEADDGGPDEILSEDFSDLGEDAADSDPLDLVEADHEDEVDPGLCPEPPDGLPDVTITADGRFRRISAMDYPGLLPRGATVYLPVAYDAEPERRFPVLYMHDGQNLFDPLQAAFGIEWTVDETIDALASEGLLGPWIVVGIDNTAERIDDYTPLPDPVEGEGGGGDAYADFMVDVLKPIVDANFRTLCGAANTAVAGSSLGGLISLHIAMRHPGLFGAVGCVSPSFWWADGAMIEAFESHAGEMPGRLWIDVGTAEGDDSAWAPLPAMVADARAVRDIALARGMRMGEQLGYLEDRGAEHNEAAWAERLREILMFLLTSRSVLELPLDGVVLFPLHDRVFLGGSPEATSMSFTALFGGNYRLTWPNALSGLEVLTPEIARLEGDGMVIPLAAGTASLNGTVLGTSATAGIEVVLSDSGSVTFNAAVPGSTPAGDVVYVTGSVPELGAWDPAGAAMTRIDAAHWTLTVSMEAGTPFEYKFTRGSWATVEKAADGSEIPNRTGTAAEGGISYDCTIEAWADL